MRIAKKALLLCALQLLIVCSVAAKFLYERATRPQIWMQVAQYDPESLMRGRYLALQPYVNVCGLNKSEADYTKPYRMDEATEATKEYWSWVVRLEVQHGILTPVSLAHTPGEAFQLRGDNDTIIVTLYAGDDCSHVLTSQHIEMYVPEHAKPPFPLAKGEETWLLATMPPKGPPRALELAIKKHGVLTPLHIR